MIILDNTPARYTCRKCGSLVDVGAMHWCYIDPPTNSIGFGWECPRCRTIHAPWVARCDCPAPTTVSNTIRLDGAA